MKVLHFILGRADPNTSNGVNKVIAGHAKYGIKHGHHVTVIGLSSSQKKDYELIERDGFNVHSYRLFFSGAFRKIRELSHSVDLIHLHSVWNNYNLIVGFYAKINAIPYIITAHSGLTDDRLKQSNYFLKWLYHSIFQKKLYDSAAGVHALTNEESSCLRKYIGNNNIFVVENGVESAHKYCNLENAHDKFKIGFLGRLAKEKNVKSLLMSLVELPDNIKNKIQVILIGPAEINYKKELDSILNEHDLDSLVEYRGALYGTEKLEALLSLDCYIHPAFSDVVSIAVMEAFSLGLPSIITRTSDVSYYYNSGAFIMVEPDCQSISNGIRLFVQSPEKHKSMSESAISLANNIFNWDVVIPKLFSEYEKLIHS
ncbi:glycosyltransferase family 4 protein [Thalassotalea sp. G20_0]|uniref:glycosyltransferase family 4 protein n=1 Tax=Thalassotalea sp. G20_0 TaxID=2821093 RepID=UPI001AD9C19A|nr:glycosyltransferase family 4 protein [Thalassotalea sp. G20_0]MBO9496921.1 glycosyltransferase family 4 protein [Thalassotalea sp. G20_0]